MELPKTEAELQALLEAKANEVTETLTAKHNSDMANMRKKHESDLAKAKEQASMTAEEIAQQKLQEQLEAKDKELAELRLKDKKSTISKKLAEAKLPSYFENDSRLLNAEAGDFDKVIKNISKEYAESLPKGASHSTILQTAHGEKPSSGSDDKSAAFSGMGEFLKEMVK